jgi:hypothetical protein
MREFYSKTTSWQDLKDRWRVTSPLHVIRWLIASSKRSQEQQENQSQSRAWTCMRLEQMCLKWANTVRRLPDHKEYPSHHRQLKSCLDIHPPSIPSLMLLCPVHNSRTRMLGAISRHKSILTNPCLIHQMYRERERGKLSTVSISQRMSPAETLSPSFLRHLAMLPCTFQNVVNQGLPCAPVDLGFTTLVVASHFKKHALLHFYLKESKVTRDYRKRSWSYIRHLSHCRGKWWHSNLLNCFYCMHSRRSKVKSGDWRRLQNV